MEKVNWSGIIFDLMKAGETLVGISRKLGVSRGCIIKLRNQERMQPTFSNGVRLIAYWQHRTQRSIPPKLNAVIKGVENGND